MTNALDAKRSSRRFEDQKPLHWGFATVRAAFSISTATSERARTFSKRTSGPWAFGFLTNENNFVSWRHENHGKTHFLARLPELSGGFAVGRNALPQSESREPERFLGIF